MHTYQKNKSVAIGAGGTGGHIFPALSVAKRLIEDGYKVIFFSDGKFYNYIKKDNPLLASGMIKVVILSCKNAPRWKQILMILKDLWKCKIIIKEKVSVCIGFGGYVSFPVILFGILTFRKTIIHEANAVLGLANRLLLPFVRICLTSFENTKKISKRMKKKKCIFVGNPIRDEIKQYVYNYDNPSVNYRAFYKIEDRINITITGGSQASGVFDEIIPQAIGMLPPSIANIIKVNHQCREKDKDFVENIYTSNGISHDVRPFFYNVGELIRGSHLLIARAGAGTIFEIMALGVPSILIPLENSADNHQFENAKILRDVNGCILMEQSTLTKERLANLLTQLFTHDGMLYDLSSNASKYAQVNADLKILAVINRMLGYLEMPVDERITTKNIRYINDNVGLG